MRTRPRKGGALQRTIEISRARRAIMFVHAEYVAKDIAKAEGVTYGKAKGGHHWFVDFSKSLGKQPRDEEKRW